MLDAVRSRSGQLVRLTDERWSHIVEGHNELAGMPFDVLEAVAEADRVVIGNSGEFLGIRENEPGKWLVVVYRELETDGFIITAFLTRRITRRIAPLSRRVQIWPS
jgi:hypothetical protein